MQSPTDLDTSLPAGAYAWEQVNSLNKVNSGEEKAWDRDSIKHHWVEQFHNKFKMSNGSAGGAKVFTLCCQNVHAKTHKQCEFFYERSISKEEGEDLVIT